MGDSGSQPLTDVTVLYTAAHGGFAGESVPLGGGAAVYEHLVAEWRRTHPFRLETITPQVLAGGGPRGRELVGFDESDYAAFSLAFERAATARILEFDPSKSVVLANDVSEGPDFARLEERGYRIFTIYHVDVVAYVTAMYLRSWVAPETTVRWERRLRPFMPGSVNQYTRLIWDKQEASVRHSRGLVVPSTEMREVLERCYPEAGGAKGKVHVLPWGNWHDVASEGREGDGAALREELGIEGDAYVLLTLSRISPEKGQDFLLEALAAWESQGTLPERPVWLVICGEAAFMQGQRYMARLRELAGRLQKIRVVFPGYVTGARKAAFYEMADVYLFPSRHESYGLTLVEALAHGVPAISRDHAGARTVMHRQPGEPEFGEMVRTRGEMWSAIAGLLKDPERRARMGRAAKAYAARERFADRAAELAQLLLHA